MTTARELLEREADLMQSRLVRDVDALAHCRPVQAVRAVRDNTATIRAIALGVASVALFVFALFTIRVLRRRRHGA